MPQQAPQETQDPTLCHRCPECQSENTKETVKSDRGSYCRCQDCGKVWHSDFEAEQLPPQAR